jgi:hypothetical protein
MAPYLCLVFYIRNMSLESYIHAGNTFSNDAFSRVKDVRVLGGTDNLLHFVCSVPYAHMYQSPMKFRDFRDSSQARAFQQVLTFFLDYCYGIAAARSKKEQTVAFDNTVVLLEACQHATKDRYVGTRIHVFTTRCHSDLTKLYQVLDYNEELCKRKNVKAGEFERHRAVNNIYAYAERVVNVYFNNTFGSSVVDTMNTTDPTHELSPANVFNLQHIYIENAKYNSPSDYMNQTDFVFPDMDNVLRIPPNMLEPEVLMNRYLVDYLMHRVNPPEAHLQLCALTYKLSLKSHSLRVDPPELDLDNDCCEFDSSEKPQMMALLKNFRVLDVSGDDTDTKCSFGFFCFRGLIAPTAEVNQTSYMSMETCGDKVLYHPMLVSQSDLSDIDLIKIRGDKLKGDMDEAKRKQFMLSEFKQRCWGDTDANMSKPLKAVVRWFNSEYDGTLFQYPLKFREYSVFANRAIRIMSVYDKLYMISTAHHPFFLINHSKYDSWRHEMDLHLNICSTGDGATSKSFLYDWMIKNSVPGTCPEFTYETAKSNAHDENNNHLRCVFHEAPQGMFSHNKHTDPQQEAAFKERLTSQKTSHRRLHIDEHTGVRSQISSVSQAIGCYFGASNDPKSKSTPAMITRFHWLESEKVYREGRNIHDCQRAEDTMSESAKQSRRTQLMYHHFEDMLLALTFQFIRIGLLTTPDLSVANIVVDNFTDILKRYGINFEGRTIERVKKLCTIMTIINAKEQLFHTPGGKHCGKPFELEQLMDMDVLMVCTEEIAFFCVGLMFNSIEGENKKKVLKAIWTLHQRSKRYRNLETHSGLESYDLNYVAMDNLKRLKQQIHGTIHEKDGKIGESAIVSVLEELSKEQMLCADYEMIDDNALGTFEDGFPEPGDRKVRQERLIKDGQSTYIHMENFRVFRENSFSDLFKECVQEIRHRFTLTRKMLIGRRIRNVQGMIEHCHLFDAIQMTPCPNESLVISGGTCYDEDDFDIVTETEESEEICLEMDLDTYGRNNRSRLLGREVPQFEAAESRYTLDYPSNLLGKLFRKRKRRQHHE